MSEFYKEAILAAHSLRGTQPKHEIRELETWQEVASALDGLDAIGRCHAIYCDWLLQLNASGGRSQIQIRDLLLGQGALAANYLGEMAQNADDAGASSLLVALEDDWLLVANNGRALSSLNLLGLCRFFIHTDGKIVGLTPDAIGKFGIGFKSCHRVADEVYVHSWGQNEEFGFRLPISQSGTEISQPDTALLEQLSEHINRVGRNFTNLRANQELGHCTPEAFEGIPNHMPDELKRRLDVFRNLNNRQGVWFALHLHDNGRNEAEQRILEQQDALYELNPLFLNHLRSVTLQNRTIRLALGREQYGNNTLDTNALRVTLEISNSDDSIRNDRLLLLSSSLNSKWKIALPADSDFKIKSPGAEQFSLRSGGGYAFLPLPALEWPWNVHFHLDAPTNLARSDWNPANMAETAIDIEDAAKKLLEWTSLNSDLWHKSWQPADILTVSPTNFAPNTSARIFAETIQTNLRNKNSIRTLWGTFIAADNAHGLRLENGQRIIDAWDNISKIVPIEFQQNFPLVILSGGVIHLGITTVTTQHAKDIFAALRQEAQDVNFWKEYIKAVLGTDVTPSGGYSRSDMLEDALREVPLNRIESADGSITIQNASETRFAVRLTDDWHIFFRDLRNNWLSPNWPLAGQFVFGHRVSQMLSSLSAATETPTGWDEVARMTLEDFRITSDAFWTAPRATCPAELANDVISAIWVESGHDWVPASELWLGDEPMAMMRGIVRQFSSRQDEFNYQRRNRIRQQLVKWGLDEAQKKVIRARVEELSAPEFSRRLREDNPANPSRLRMLTLAENWKPERLPLEWRDFVASAAKVAVKELFELTWENRYRGKTMLIGGGAISRVLAWLPDYIEAPVWLEPAAVTWFETQGIFREYNLDTKVTNILNRQQKDKLGRELLGGFRHWPNLKIADSERTVLDDLFQNATGNWTVGYQGGIDKQLGEHFALSENSDDAYSVCILAGKNNLQLLGISQLPEMLADFPSLAAKCIPISALAHQNVIAEDHEEKELIEAEIPEGILNNPYFIRLIELLDKPKVVSIAGSHSLKWNRGNIEIAIENADFGICQYDERDAIFIAEPNRQPPPQDPDKDNRYREILIAYTLIAPDDKEIKKAVRKNNDLAKIYRDNRAKIRARLVQAHATDIGYEAKHVMRELLQNAESAYASRHHDRLPESRIFQVDAESRSNGAEWKVSITHHGRAFNENDKNGNARNDIDRLCATAAPQNYINEEVGRFNSGFKSVFHVTNEVKVISGGYTFRVEDMLLLNPADPAHDPLAPSIATIFEFKIESSKKADLFREKMGKARPFRSLDLVFLRCVNEVVINIQQQPNKKFYLGFEPMDENGWEIMTITEQTEEIQKKKKKFHHFKDQYLVRQSTIDLTDNVQGQARVAVALALDEKGLPIPIKRENRYFYRTFPLQQNADWLPVLINADFFTESGRAGLLPKAENEELIIYAVEMTLDIVKSRIEKTCGDISSWVRWVELMDRRVLMDGAAMLNRHRKHFVKKIKDFDLWISLHLPNGRDLLPASDFYFPSRLMRRIKQITIYDTKLAIDDSSWVDAKVADALQPFGIELARSWQLREQISSILTNGKEIEEVRRWVEQLSREEFTFDAVSRNEIQMALDLLAISTPLPPPIPPDEELTQDLTQDLTIEQINNIWNEQEALQQFTLAGWMGNLVFPELENANGDAQAQLLRCTDSLEGKRAWYRLFCLGSLLGARAHTNTVRRFWDDFLVPRDVFKVTFEHGNLSQILDDISHQRFSDLDATGEFAELWRRVYYDFQKLRLFVFEDDLAGAFLEHIEQERNPDAAINFLKSGFRSNNHRWTCAVGQSMTTPLFWIMRELRRIGVIDHDSFDPICFYLNGPSRRVAARLGWISTEQYRSYNFESLLEMSRSCYYEPGQLHKVHFDLPLQWYAYQNPV